MRMSERWRNDAKAAPGVGDCGANFPGRVDVGSMLKRLRRVPVLHLCRSSGWSDRSDPSVSSGTTLNCRM